MRKLILTTALLGAMVSAKAQTSQNAKFESVIINKKCPSCGDLARWNYSRVDFTERLTNPEWNAWIEIDMEKMVIRTEGGTRSPFTFQINERAMSQTYIYANQKLTVFYNSKVEYIGHRIED